MQILIIIKLLSLKNAYALLSINTLEDLLYRIEASVCSKTHTHTRSHTHTHTMIFTRAFSIMAELEKT